MTELTFSPQQYNIYGFESTGSHIIPPFFQPKKFSGDTILWLLPKDKRKPSKMILCKEYSVHIKKKIARVRFNGESEVKLFPAKPCCDFFGKRFSFDIDGKVDFEKAFACFYWDNLLCQNAERTFMRKKKDIREGYVLSTLNKKAYAGTYPAVDHEFHMKGRFAVGGKSEEELIKRMLLLQLKIMAEDKKKMSRNVCSVQPNRRREYNIWRYSQNKKVKAQMFRITANIEFVEALYNYYCLTKDLDFLKDNINATEKNCDYIESFIKENSLLDSHVYYEDQVIKDGAVLQAQLFAANSFRLMAEFERLLSRENKAEHYAALSKELGKNAVRTYPHGFWDKENERFIDWIDSKGEKHDRIHLLANELPELFGYADENQIQKSREVLENHKNVFDKFPSFVAAETEKYTPDEIGSGGPYDLCAAGRYWCWDGEYLAFIGNAQKLKSQLKQVIAEAEKDEFFMGERYDMNYVYYNTGEDGKRNWHGASLYYEYPNVFIYLLICKYIGVRRGFNEDLIIEPLFENGKVNLETYGISFETENTKVKWVKNIGDKVITVTLPSKEKTLTLNSGEWLEI